MPKVSKLDTQAFSRGPGSKGQFVKCRLYMEWDQQCLQYKETVFWKKLFFNKVVRWEAKPGGYRDSMVDTRYPPGILLRTATEEREFAIPHAEFDNWLYWIIRSLMKYSTAPIPDEQLSGLSPKHKAKIQTRRDMSAFDQSHEVFIHILEELEKGQVEVQNDKKPSGPLFQDLPKMKFGLPKDWSEGPEVRGRTTGGITYSEVGNKIGKGGSGTVIFEIQKLLEPILIKQKSGTGFTLVRPSEPMIVKVPKYSKDDPTTLKGVIREARILGTLGRHPHIVGLIDAHVHGPGRIYLFLEKGYADFMSFMTPKPALNPPQIRKYAMGILSGIDHMHQRRIYHLDMKPENVILCQGDTPKIIDFGNAKTRIIDSKDDMFGPMAWSQYGTKGYIPPESWKPGSMVIETDFIKRDAYAVGMTLFDALLTPYYGWPAFPMPGGPWLNEKFILEHIQHFHKLVRKEGNRKRLIEDRLLVLADAASGMIDPDPKVRLTVTEAWEFMKADQKQHRKEQLTSYRQEDLTSTKTILTEYQYLKDQLKKSQE